MSSKEHFRLKLHETGLKATPSRLAVLDVLSKTHQPLTVEEIIARSKGRGGDQATVYRILGSLKDKGHLRQIDFQHGHAHYELVDLKDHHHLVCIKCERVEDVKGCNVDKLAKSVLRKTRSFANITEHSLELFGLCKQCL